MIRLGWIMTKKRRKRAQKTTIHIAVSYDGELPALIGDVYQDWEMDASAPFIELFANIVRRFPVLIDNYQPGSLGIVLNGQPLNDPTQLLKNGDIVGLVAPVAAVYKKSDSVQQN